MQQNPDGWYYLILTKVGPGGVNLTAGPTRIYDRLTTEAMHDLGQTMVDQTEGWQAARTQLTNMGLAFDYPFDHDQLLIGGTPVTIAYNNTFPQNNPATQNPDDYTLPDALRDTILVGARAAVRAIVQNALSGLNAFPPTQFVVSLVTLPGTPGTPQVHQQSFWTTVNGVRKYRVILRTDKILNERDSMAGRESRRGLTGTGKEERYAKATVTHEVGHMIHAFSDSDKFLTALYTIAQPPPANQHAHLQSQKDQITRVNTDVMLALNAKGYKAKWGYATDAMRKNPAEAVAEVFTALIHGQNVPKGLAAVYVAYGGIRSNTIDEALRKSFGGAIPTISQPQDAIPIINEP
jgi:hypothetical protein